MSNPHKNPKWYVSTGAGKRPSSSNWILETGTWNDSGVWIDTETWNDN